MNFAYWRKCDFQIHSPRDPNWIGLRPIGIGNTNDENVAKVADVRAARLKWAEALVEKCVKRGLGAIAITDHHEMLMVSYVQEVIDTRSILYGDIDLWCFPGMELTARNGVQCLILFDARLSEEWRRAAMGKLGIFVANLDEHASQSPRVTQLTCSYPEISSELDTLENLRGKFIVLPNVSQGGPHTVLTDGAHADFRSMSYVGGYVDRGQTITTIGPKNTRRLSGLDTIWGNRFIYPMPTSDSRSADFAHIGTNDCWIKLAAPTAEAIRQAFLGHQSRISISKPSRCSLSILSARLSGSTILKDLYIELSPEFNSLIGGRGSGKSTLLEYITFGLGRSCFDLAKNDYSNSERMSSLINDTLISSGGEITLCVEQDGAVFEIRRSGANGHQPQVTYPDKSLQYLSPKELRSLFPAIAYSQGELSEIGKQAGKRAQLSDLLQFVDPEFKREDDRLTSEIEAKKYLARQNLQLLSDSWLKQSAIHKLTSSKASIDQRIVALQKTLPTLSDEDQKIVRLYDDMALFDGRRLQALKQTAHHMEQMASLMRTHQSIELSSDIPITHNIKQHYDTFSSVFTDGIAKIQSQLNISITEMTAASAVFVAAFKAAKLARDRVLGKLTEHRSVTAQITNLQQESQSADTKIAELQTLASGTSEIFDNLKTAISVLKKAVASRADKTKTWATQIEAASGGRIQAQLNVDGDWSEIREALDAVSTKTFSQEAGRHRKIGEQIAASSPWEYLDSVRSDCLSALRWKLLGPAIAGDEPSCASLMQSLGGSNKTRGACLDLISVIRIEGVVSATPKPDITLYYCDGDRKISFEKASEGQRAAALLFMLLDQKGGPLFVDQPEGDLDNKIISDLSEKLHLSKQRRQIIMVSHNANIVVNGSSELVAHLHVDDEGKREIQGAGAIDAPEICKIITATMEGGKKAFCDRQSKYGY